MDDASALRKWFFTVCRMVILYSANAEMLCMGSTEMLCFFIHQSVYEAALDTCVESCLQRGNQSSLAAARLKHCENSSHSCSSRV